MKFSRIFMTGLALCGLQSYAANLNYDFESGADDWGGRGDATVQLTSDQHHSGNQSLFVSNRASSWHGATMQNAEIKAGKTYNFSVFVFVTSNARIDLSLQYSADGEAAYPGIANAEVYGYNWTELKGQIVIPEGVTDIQPYIQCTSSDTQSFYIDDFKCEEEVEDLVDFSSQLPLKDLFADYFKIGTAATASEITPQNAKNMVLHHFNSLTPGNELKPDALLDQAASQSEGNNVNPKVRLSPAAKTILKFCNDTKIPMRGHVFVWHSQTPDWFFNENFADNGRTVSREVMSQRMENYIKNVVELVTTSYPDLNIYAWDIVNEAFHNDQGAMREPGSNYQKEGASRWMEVYGDNSFIYEAFTYAKKYIPLGCKMYYNDYNEYIPGKRDGIYNMVKDLYSKGLCDGIGMQSHLSTQYPSVALYKEALEKYATIGCDIQITELDITIESGANEETQAQMYKELFDVYRSHKESISLVAVWGTNDEISWRAYGKPLIFSNFQPKPAYDKIIEGMSLPEIPTTDVADASANASVYATVAQGAVTVHCEGDFSYQLIQLSGAVVEEGKGCGEKAIGAALPSALYLVKVTKGDGSQVVLKVAK